MDTGSQTSFLILDEWQILTLTFSQKFDPSYVFAQEQMKHLRFSKFEMTNQLDKLAHKFPSYLHALHNSPNLFKILEAFLSLEYLPFVSSVFRI